VHRACESDSSRWPDCCSEHFEVEQEEGRKGEPVDLLPGIKKGFNAKKTFRKAVLGMMAMKRMRMMTHQAELSPRAQELMTNVKKYMEDSEKEVIDADKTVIHHHNDGHSSHSDEELDGMADRLKQVDDASVPGGALSGPNDPNSKSIPHLDHLPGVGQVDGALPGQHGLKAPKSADPPLMELKTAAMSDSEVVKMKKDGV